MRFNDRHRVIQIKYRLKAINALIKYAQSPKTINVITQDYITSGKSRVKEAVRELYGLRYLRRFPPNTYVVEDKSALYRHSMELIDEWEQIDPQAVEAYLTQDQIEV